MPLLISFLVFLVVVVVVTAFVVAILRWLGASPFDRYAMAVAALVVLIWVLRHLGEIVRALSL